MKQVLLSFSLFFLATSVWAQQYKLSGTVTREGKPLSNASVYVEKASSGTQTNEFGSYELLLEKGVYKVEFLHGNRKTIQVDLNSDKTLNVDLSGLEEVLGEVFLQSVRVNAESPITYSELSNEEIADRNLGQDIPTLMNYMPNVVTTSDAGAGVGYSGIRVRGSDATRINVTINGIPYNDSESQGTFWVNLGDFASSVQNLQLQRGVGTSTNGAGAFGASLNILTDNFKKDPYAEIANTYGSYNTHKHTVKFSTGLFNDHFEFKGRASKIESDGYVDRASTELKSYFLQGTYKDDKTIIKAITFGGTEQTYMAWNGIDKETLETNRTYNSAGRYVDEDGNVQFYDNQTDNYKQDHYQLLWNQTYTENWSSNIALHYTKGKGYYEQYHEGATLNDYKLQNFIFEGEEVTKSDLVDQQSLDNDFYGTVFSLKYENSKFDATIGGGFNQYKGDHFGEVIYTKFAMNKAPEERYYFSDATKNDFNIYGKVNFSIVENLAGYVDLQLRTISYKTEGILDNGSPIDVDDNFEFFNPKFGVNYKLNSENRLYASYARANREPNRSDYKNGNPNSEKLNDWELGWRHNSESLKLNANLYYMDYRDQLVLTGAIDNVGSFVRANSGNSYRLGLEVDATIPITSQLSIRPNISLSRNKNKDFKSTQNEELVNYGDTDISFSPKIVAGNIIGYTPTKGLELKLLSKYIGKQYMTNFELETSQLDDYFVTDFNIQYTWDSAPIFKEVVFTGLVNNIFDAEYVSNGYYDPKWGTYYYPQATINFLTGITLRF
ncbi:TonB-dependent receptor [Zunongwangia sp.]|uniref:TonB-dependent receptor n=1 Tax=Zunongwangia sp. TaxID=1965325 RepID=UPI003AA89ECF